MISRCQCTREPSRSQDGSELHGELTSRPALEKALFDDRPIATMVMLALVAGIFAMELVANARNGGGWISMTHLAVIGILELLTLYGLWLGLRRCLWRWRLTRRQR